MYTLDPYEQALPPLATPPPARTSERHYLATGLCDEHVHIERWPGTKSVEISLTDEDRGQVTAELDQDDAIRLRDYLLSLYPVTK